MNVVRGLGMGFLPFLPLYQELLRPLVESVLCSVGCLPVRQRWMLLPGQNSCFQLRGHWWNPDTRSFTLLEKRCKSNDISGSAWAQWAGTGVSLDKGPGIQAPRAHLCVLAMMARFSPHAASGPAPAAPPPLQSLCL